MDFFVDKVCYEEENVSSDEDMYVAEVNKGKLQNVGECGGWQERSCCVNQFF